MQENIRVIAMLLAGLLSVAFHLSCDKKAETKRPVNAAPQVHTPTADEIAMDVRGGVWEATVGDPKKPSEFSSKMAIEFHSDNTILLVTEISDPQIGKMVKKAEGKWLENGDYYEVTLEKSLTGQEIPPDQRNLKFGMFSDAQGTNHGVHLKLDPSGPQFNRKDQ